jgi:TatA/E family protein of Tat protein translocase
MGIESPVHLLFIAIVALIVLGPKRLPGLARALGQGIREFRGSLEAGAEPADEPVEAAETSVPHTAVATPDSRKPPPDTATATAAPPAPGAPEAPSESGA